MSLLRAVTHLESTGHSIAELHLVYVLLTVGFVASAGPVSGYVVQGNMSVALSVLYTTTTTDE